MKAESQRWYTPVLAFLLLACMGRVWLPLLPESFWLDETVTAFAIRYGANHPSFAAAPRLDQTIYYWLPRASQALFGFSEFSLRLPSVLVTIVSLFLIGRLAARFVHPQAAWVAVFLCFVPREFTRLATDARPYGLATSVALCAMWFLVRWLDRGAWRDAPLFAVFAALLLRVHLIDWPFYAVYGCYALLRLVRKETPVSRGAMAAVFSIVGASLLPLVPVTLALSRDAGKYIVAEMPTLRIVLTGFQFPMIAGAGAGMWVLGKAFRWPRPPLTIADSDTTLLLIWWLWPPAFLLAVSWITGNSIFIARYFSLALPGMILTGTLAAAYSIPDRAWKPVALALAAGILCVSLLKSPLQSSRNSHWREAALSVNQLARYADTPVVCPSPFVAAQPPVWTPDYALPGYLYAHLAIYPIPSCAILLPARRGAEGERYARTMVEHRIARAGRFIIYGGVWSEHIWQNWFTDQPEFARWNHRQVGEFGDVKVILFERPGW